MDTESGWSGKEEGRRWVEEGHESVPEGWANVNKGPEAKGPSPGHLSASLTIAESVCRERGQRWPFFYLECLSHSRSFLSIKANFSCHLPLDLVKWEQGRMVCSCLIFLLPTVFMAHLWEWVPVWISLKLTMWAIKVITVYRILTICGELHIEDLSHLLLAKITQEGTVSRLEVGNWGSERVSSMPSAIQQV